MPRQDIQLNTRLDKFDRALVIATYFGFTPIQAPKITKQDIALTRNYGGHPHYDAVDRISVIRTYLEQNFSSLPHPLAIAYKKPKLKKRLAGHSLHFIGSSSSIAEATLIQATLSILSEEGYKNLIVDINCTGDKESINIYERELASYVRKSGINLSEELKKCIKDDVLNLFRLETPEALQLSEVAPSSITFLSAPSRIYFKEVLEYIEALGVEFRLIPKLIGEKNHTSHTIFAIKNREDEDILAVGYRYSQLARLLGSRKDVPMTGINIFSTPQREAREKIYKELPKPKFYLVQLGREAKIRTLKLIEMLRSHRIPVHHFLGRDRITSQLSNAEHLHVSHIIIIGQKEALDNTATIRNMSTRAQDTVSITDLPRYLKKITL